MAEKRRGLGRGLGALIPTEPARVGGSAHPTDVFFRERSEGASVTPLIRRPETAVASSPASVLPPARDDGRLAQNPTSGNDDPSDDSAPAPAGADGELRRVPGASFEEIPLDDITPNARQPREVFDEDDLDELAHSIREIGVLQPIVVRPLGDSDTGKTGNTGNAGNTGNTGNAGNTGNTGNAGATDGPRYEIVMGERRWRASRAAGQATVPAIVRRTDDDAMLRDALLENLHRSQLNPLEEAAAYQQLLEDFGCTHEELAARIGRSRPQITNVIRLLRLPPLVARRVAAGVISAGHARALLGLPDGAAMERLAQRIVAEGLSVRTVEEIVAMGSDDTPPTRRRRAASTRVPELDDLAARLADRLDTRVSIAMGRSKGKMTVEFASVDDLNRILEAIRDRPDGAATPATA